jgi:uncharacterized protein (DUF302 family)
MTPQMIEKTLKDAGITVLSNEDLNKEFMTIYNKSDFKVYSLITYYHKELSAKLLKANPNMGLFYPTRLIVFQKKEDPILWVALISSRTMGKVLNLKKRETLLAELLADYDRSILRPIIKSMKKSRFNQINSSQLRQVRTLNLHQKEAKGNQAIAKIEAKLKKRIAASNFELKNVMNLNKTLGKESPYDFYKSYQLRNLKTLFTKSSLYPESAAHAPYQLVIYKKKGSRYVTMTQVDTAHVIDSSDITDTASLKALIRDQKEIDDLLKGITK